MKILYDHQIFSSRTYGGILRYFCSMLNSYTCDPEITFRVAIKYSDAKYFYSTSHGINVAPFLKRSTSKGLLYLPSKLINGMIVKPTNAYRRFVNERFSISSIRKYDFDIFHPTYYNPYFIDYINNKPFVLTVYDLIHERFPELFGNQKQVVIWKSQLIRRATKIIAISNCTKNDLVSHYKISPHKIEVIYLANGFFTNNILNANEARGIKLPERYLLYVGDRRGYKNFNFLITSVSEVLLKDKTLHVICGGGPPFTTDEIDLFNLYNIHNQIQYIPISNDAELVALYKNALAFIFPSLYEGFGIPILESFICECPIILCNAGALPEVAGDACLKFDPDDKDSLVNAIREVISNENLRKRLVKKGSLREKNFSWDRTAVETKQLYKSLL